MHFSFALSGFIKAHVPHVHPPLFEGGFSPAALQLNPPPVPLLVIAVVAVVVFGSVEPDPVKLNAGPAGLGPPNENADGVVEVDDVELDEPNGNGPEGVVGVEKPFFEPALASEEDTPGLEVLQTVHFSLADAGFIRSQVPHFHPSPCFGGFKPAAPQLNPPLAVGRVVRLVLEPAFLMLDCPTGLEERLHLSSTGIS